MEQSSEAHSYGVSKGYSWYVFSLLFLLYMFDYIDRFVVSSLSPFIKADWGLTDTQMGMMKSAVYWSILLFTFPVSVLIDRWSRKNSIGIMAVLWTIATAACAFTKNFTQLFTARAMIGVGEAGYAPGGGAMISALFPRESRSLAIGIWTAAIPLGGALGTILGGIIAETLGWRYAFGLVAFPGLIVAFLFFRVKDYKSVKLEKTVDKTEEGPGKAKMTKKDIANEFIRTPSVIFTYLGFAGNTFVTTALLFWLPTYIYRTLEISMKKAAMLSGAVMALAIIGAPLGGYLADRWMKRRINARLLFASIASILSAITVFAAFGLKGGAIWWPMLFGSGIVLASFVPAAAAVTQDVVHPGLRATSYSFCVIFQHLLGSAIGPIFVGFVSDRYGLNTAMTILPVFSVIACILFFIGSFFYARDLEKVEKVALETGN